MNNCIKLHVFLRWGIVICQFLKLNLPITVNILFESAKKINIIIHGNIGTVFKTTVEPC